MTDTEIINQARLHNVWIGGHMDALRDAIEIVNEVGTLAEASDALHRKLILAEDMLRRIRERS